MLAMIVASVVGLAIVYQFVIEPYLQKRKALQEQIEAREDELYKADKMYKEQKRLKTVLAGLTEGGLKSDVAEARSQLLYALSGWTKDAGVNLKSLKEGRTVEEGNKWIQINTQSTATGPQAAIAQLLWRLETAKIPVRVTEMTINAVKEGTDELQINLGVSTLCQNPNADKPDPASRQRVATASGREP